MKKRSWVRPTRAMISLISGAGCKWRVRHTRRKKGSNECSVPKQAWIQCGAACCIQRRTAPWRCRSCLVVFGTDGATQRTAWVAQRVPLQGRCRRQKGPRHREGDPSKSLACGNCIGYPHKAVAGPKTAACCWSDRTVSCNHCCRS